MSTVFKRLESGINILPILKQVAENFNDFNLPPSRRTAKDDLREPVQKETMALRLVKGVPVSGKGSYFSRLNKSHEIIKTELYYKYNECVYFLNWFEKIYGGKIYRVTIVHLSAGGKVYPHTDPGDYYENKDRFHLGLSGYYDFTVDDETQRFGAGDLFWFDNKKIHSSINATPIPRISLIFDVEGCTIC